MRQECPKCGGVYVGCVYNGPVLQRTRRDGDFPGAGAGLGAGVIEHYRARQFPCFHCQIIVTWFQVCAPDGTYVDARQHRREVGYLKGSYYHRWLATHPDHAAQEMETA